MSKIDIDAQRTAFQLALVAGAEHLRPNFSPVEVESGYSGYKEPLMEATFSGWLLREREALAEIQRLEALHSLREPLGYKALDMLQRRWRNVPPAVVRAIVRNTEREHGITRAGRHHPKTVAQTDRLTGGDKQAPDLREVLATPVSLFWTNLKASES